MKTPKGLSKARTRDNYSFDILKLIYPKKGEESDILDIFGDEETQFKKNPKKRYHIQALNFIDSLSFDITNYYHPSDVLDSGTNEEFSNFLDNENKSKFVDFNEYEESSDSFDEVSEESKPADFTFMEDESSEESFSRHDFFEEVKNNFIEKVKNSIFSGSVLEDKDFLNFYQSAKKEGFPSDEKEFLRFLSRNQDFKELIQYRLYRFRG